MPNKNVKLCVPDAAYRLPEEPSSCPSWNQVGHIGTPVRYLPIASDYERMRNPLNFCTLHQLPRGASLINRHNVPHFVTLLVNKSL